jgi:hypothetical protein
MEIELTVHTVAPEEMPADQRQALAEFRKLVIEVANDNAD